MTPPCDFLRLENNLQRDQPAAQASSSEINVVPFNRVLYDASIPKDNRSGWVNHT